MKKIFVYLLLYLLGMQGAFAQRASLSKLSPMLRRYVLQDREESRRKVSGSLFSPSITAFVKVSGDGRDMLEQEDCRIMASWGNIHIVSIPMSRLARLSLMPEVQRIEANMSSKCMMDSAVIQVNALPVYEGRNLPQAFTGKGVVMGIMDIGFDLTHPNFWNPQMSEYRIKALWDMISKDTLHSELPVGRDYVGEEMLLAKGCSTDGLDQTHGTHTLGIAAGSGGEGVPMSLPGKYHGIAYESDICLVANATSENQELIDSVQKYKFTYAMDALGFKYIFDYADKVGKPCVISFSEGSGQDFDGNDVLYHEVLDSLTSVPGHIIVSSAGNNGMIPSYMHKPNGKVSAGFFVNSSRNFVYHTAKSAQPFSFRTRIYEGERLPEIFDVSTDQVLSAPDSTWIDTLEVSGKKYALIIGAYPNCYAPQEICYDWVLQRLHWDGAIGEDNRIAYQVVGEDADISVYRGSGNMYKDSKDLTLCDAELSHSINSPASYESVICVGSTINHTYSVDVNGNKQNVEVDPMGSWVKTSSIGPTFDERIKPDLVAPGNNVISSYSSFYEDNHPEAGDVVRSDVARFDYQGRTYAWNNNAGTSMASPVVGGAVALWLQANPKLTRKDVMEIIRKTSRPLDAGHEIPNNYWGYGELDVYRGLLAALQVDGIDAISLHQPNRALIDVKDGHICIDMDKKTERGFKVAVYDLRGVCVYNQTMSSGECHYQIPTTHLHSGVYIVQMSGCKQIEGSAIVRL